MSSWIRLYCTVNGTFVFDECVEYTYGLPCLKVPSSYKPLYMSCKNRSPCLADNSVHSTQIWFRAQQGLGKHDPDPKVCHEHRGRLAIPSSRLFLDCIPPRGSQNSPFPVSAITGFCVTCNASAPPANSKSCKKKLSPAFQCHLYSALSAGNHKCR